MIQGTVFGDDIKVFDELLSVKCIYHLSNTNIQKVPKAYQYVDNEYELIFWKGTVIEKVSYESFSTPEHHPTYVPIGDLESLMQLPHFDILVFVVHVHQQRDVQGGKTIVRDLVVIDKHASSGITISKSTKDIASVFEVFDTSTQQNTIHRIKAAITGVASDTDFWYILKIKLTDSSTSTWVTLFGNMVESLLGCKVEEFVQLDNKAYAAVCGSRFNSYSFLYFRVKTISLCLPLFSSVFLNSMTEYMKIKAILKEQLNGNNTGGSDDTTQSFTCIQKGAGISEGRHGRSVGGTQKGLQGVGEDDALEGRELVYWLHRATITGDEVLSEMQSA
ncbi:hypothetical protein QJS10_CPB17g00113 [Acorus calamus]|uniref:Uncharacterized protein n=1 Tax=Acorus calamus TaxID=4465 RepID=A0AAV9CT93_ACOCL|nr:hypothetical protein QJS10_CPB17g00113 [Acorus calamus]